MPGKIPDLVRERLEQLNVEIDDLSLAGLHEHISHYTPKGMYS
jgi:hypothetical protein